MHVYRSRECFKFEDVYWRLVSCFEYSGGKWVLVDSGGQAAVSAAPSNMVRQQALFIVVLSATAVSGGVCKGVGVLSAFLPLSGRRLSC